MAGGVLNIPKVLELNIFAFLNHVVYLQEKNDFEKKQIEALKRKG